MNRDVKIATVQMEHTSFDKEANFEKIKAFTAQASDAGAEILVFPECCITGYWCLRHSTRQELLELAENIPSGPSSKKLMDLSQQTGMTIGAGLVEKDSDQNLYNSYIVAMPNGELKSHRKLHCFVNAEMSSGSQYTVFDTPHGCRVGVLICYDNNLVETVRITALRGADIILAPHQTGGCQTQDPNIMGLVNPELWYNRESDPEAIKNELKGDKGRGWLMRWLPSRAHDNGVFYAFSNGVGMDDNEVRTGNAMIIDSYGRILEETWAAADAMIIANLDHKLRDDNTGQRWITARRPDLYTPLTQRTGKEVDIRTARFGGKGA